MASDTRRLKVVVTGESGQAQQAVEAVGQSAEKTESRLGKLAKSMAAWGVRGAVAMGAIGIAAGGMGLKTAMGLEQAEVGFSTMLGSAEKARKFIGDLQKFAAATPFEFPELVGSAQQFLAMGFAAKDVIPMLTAVGDAVAAMGGSAENVDSVTRAFSQMQAKGKVASDELMQLTEQGIPALQILADSYGVSTTQMQQMIEKGQVLSAKAIPALIKGLESGTKHVKGFGGMMEAQSGTIAGKWSTLMDNLQTGLAKFVLNFTPQIKQAMDIAGKAIGDFFAGLQGQGKLAGFSGTINEIGLGLRAMVEAFKGGGVTSDGLVGKFERIGVAAGKVYDAFVKVVEITKEIVGWFMQHKTTSEALAIAIGALVVVTQAHALALWISSGNALIWLKAIPLVSAATKVWAAIQWILNAAFWAWPGTWIIAGILALIAVVVIMYNKVGWFRDFVDAAWKIIKNAFAATIDWIVGTAWPALKAFFEGVANIAVWFYQNIMVPLWNGIRNAVSTVVDFFISYVWPIFKFIFDAIGSTINVLYNVIWKPIWILIQIAVLVFVSFITNYFWPQLKATFTLLGNIVSWLWNNVFGPAWNGIKAVIGFVVDWFMATAWPKLKLGFELIKAIVLVLWNEWKERFDKIKEKVTEVMDAAGRAFEKGKNAIASAWGQIQDAAKKPVNFVIGTVYNEGIRKLWNTVAAKFGIGTRLDEIKQLAGGGVMPGYAPGKDTIPAILSPGEGVLVPEAVKQLGAKRVLTWNQQARAGQSLVPYKDGGIVDWGRNLLDKGKDIFQGAAGAVVEPLINGLRGVLDGIPNGEGFGGLLKGGANKLLDAFLSWVKGKDSDAVTSGNGQFGNWPSSPSAQRGDSGVWRSVVALIKSTGPISGTFGNAYRPGDPLWHGSGRAVDWMGYNQDALATFLAAHNPLELIHRSSRRDYAYTRGVNKGSFNNVLMEQHRNHVHIAMDEGGVLPPGSTTLVTNATTRQEYALTEDKIQRLGGVRIDTVVINVDANGKDAKQFAKDVRDELVKLAGRNGGNTGLPKK
jgi:tape measure domain-containing protein